jgi:hypothetical protein
MINPVLREERALPDNGKGFPEISIIMPFDPKMVNKADLALSLKRACDKVEKKLLANYPAGKAFPILRKLKSMISRLDYSTYKISVALFVSLLVEKIFYLDIPVEEKVIVDDSFEIRDLVYSKKDLHKYLVLVLSGKRSRIYLGNTNGFERIVSHVPQHIAAYRNDVPEPVANYSDPSHRKEVMLDKFLRHTDNGLSIIVKAYSLPLFVLGAIRTLGHFRKITHNAGHILATVHGNFEEASEKEIRDALAPHIADWKKVRQQDLLLQMEEASGAGKLTSGIEAVRQYAAAGKGRLLIVEKNFISPVRHTLRTNAFSIQAQEADDRFYIKDEVDDIIGKILENGGNVEFVDEGVLKDHARIVLITYY